MLLTNKKKKACKLNKFTDGMLYLAIRGIVRYKLESLRLSLIKEGNSVLDYDYWTVKFRVQTDELISVCVCCGQYFTFGIKFPDGWLDNEVYCKKVVEKNFSWANDPEDKEKFVEENRTDNEPFSFKKITEILEIL